MVLDEEVKELLIQHRNIIERLKELGVIRSQKVTSDYGEYVACKKLGLTQVDSSVNKGYDAKDKDGEKYEIKTRKAATWTKPTKFSARKQQLRYADFLIYVEFDNNWNVVRLLKIPTQEVRYSVDKDVVLTKALVEKYSVLNHG